jgi:uncharacterized radical SAM superfamily Fe-S cluster-containing enzyme
MRSLDLAVEKPDVDTQASEHMMLPIRTQSLCPECLGVIAATLHEAGGRIFMSKQCPTHGPFRELISSDATFFRLMIQRDMAVTRKVAHPLDSGGRTCPQACGLCGEHLSGPVMMNIDLTNRCNLSCPICFANADARREVVELSLDQVRRMLDQSCAIHDVQASCLQYTGGEPTVHPEFLQALREARARNFAQVQVATNGIRFGKDAEFAAQAGEAGLNLAYLQFDGLSDDVYQKTRGRPLLDIKLAAIENLYAVGIRTILVPTVAKGINDDQLGRILRFAIEHNREIGGISWQPIAFTGRLDYEQRLSMRFTIADLARGIEQQSGLIHKYRDWYPFGFVDPFGRLIEVLDRHPTVGLSCNPICGACTYLIVDSKTNEAAPLPAFVDVEPMMETVRVAAERLKRGGMFNKLSVTRQLRKLRRFYHEDAAPPDWSFDGFVDFLTDFVDFRQRYGNNEARLRGNESMRHRPMLMACMHFQDAYNYQLDRVQRCLVHYAAPDGRIYPFCSYNSGPCHRKQVEARFAVPLEQYLAAHPGGASR